MASSIANSVMAAISPNTGVPKAGRTLLRHRLALPIIAARPGLMNARRADDDTHWIPATKAMPERPFVCVFCGSLRGTRPPYSDAARRLGTSLAREGLGVVYGGGRVGLMGVVAD